MGLSIDRAYSECAEKLHSIEEELHAQPITDELREQIIHELDEVHENLSQCETTAASVNLFAQSFLKELQAKAVFLYGEVDDFYHQHEIAIIKNEADDLSHLVQQKDFLKLAKVIDALRGHLSHLLDTYSPDLKERRVIVFAKMTLEKAEALMQGKTLDLEASPEDMEVTEALMEEIAEYLGNDDRLGLRLLMSRLTARQRQLVMYYLDPKDLMTQLFHDVERPTADDHLFRG